jgi:hypothetical protein
MSDTIIDLDATLVADIKDCGAETLILKYPITVKYRKNNIEREEHITQISFRRCNGGDLKALAQGKTEMDQAIILFTRLASIMEAVYDQLDAEDITKGMEIIERFLPQSPKTGTVF